MKKLSVFLVCAGFALSTLFAQDEKKAEKKQSDDPVVVAIALASQLATYGQTNKDPFSLVSAAQILIKHPKAGASPDFVEDVTEEAGDKEGNKQKNAQSVELDAKKLLASAKSMANGNTHLLAMISDMEGDIPEKPALTRGALGGAVYTSKLIRGYGTMRLTCTFRGGRYAEIRFIGDGDSDLDFYVYDSSGRRIAYNTSYGDNVKFYWVPRYTERYTFKVKNLGSRSNHFVIITN